MDDDHDCLNCGYCRFCIGPTADSPRDPRADPRPGDRFVANGVRFTVQMTDAEWVYGVRYRAGVTPADVNAAIAAGREPPGYLGNCRVERAGFAAEVTAAMVEKATQTGENP